MSSASPADEIDAAAAGDAPAAEPTPDVSEASSSDADPGVDRAGLLDAITKVVSDTETDDLIGGEPKPEPSPDAEGSPSSDGAADVPDTDAQPDPKPDTAETPDKDAKQADNQAADAPLPDEPDETELKAYPPRTRRRIEQLLEQRRQLSERVKPWDTVQTFLADNRIENDDFVKMLGVTAALSQGDYQGFLRQVAPYVKVAQEVLGLTIPADLMNEVRQGKLTQAHARELTKARYASLQHRQEAQTANQRADQTRRVATAGAIKTAVDGFEVELQRTDADYAAKQPAIRRFAQALMAEQGPPQPPEAAIAMVRLAHQEATEWAKRYAPAPAATKPKPNGAGATQPVRAKPTTMLEAAEQGLMRARQA